MKSIAKYEMKAIAPVEVAGVKYAPGQTFSVEAADTRQFLLDCGAAGDCQAETETEASVPTPEEQAQPTSKENEDDKPIAAPGKRSFRRH